MRALAITLLFVAAMLFLGLQAAQSGPRELDKVETPEVALVNNASY